MQGKNVVATAIADAVRLQNATSSDSVVIDFQETGHPRLSEIFFSGQRVAFELRAPSSDTNIKTSSQSADPLPSGLQ